MRIGFIGQGFIGKNYADDFEGRGFTVVRYALEEPYRSNKDQVAACDLVFIAVPTPTTPQGFDDAVLRAVLPLVGVGKTAVIKSTTLPGTVKELQALFPDRLVLHSPEFLAEKTAAFDAAHPQRNIIGIPLHTEPYHDTARQLLALLPQAPYELVTDSTTSELIKYAGNSFLYWKVLFANTLYEISQALGTDYEVVRGALAADPRIGPSHLRVIDQSGHEGSVAGRGAGGHCLIKDFAALRALVEGVMQNEPETLALLRALESKNNKLLRMSGKDLDLLRDVYGE